MAKKIKKKDAIWYRKKKQQISKTLKAFELKKKKLLNDLQKIDDNIVHLVNEERKMSTILKWHEDNCAVDVPTKPASYQSWFSNLYNSIVECSICLSEDIPFSQYGNYINCCHGACISCIQNISDGRCQMCRKEIKAYNRLVRTGNGNICSFVLQNIEE